MKPQQATMTLLPPAADKCQLCAVDHEPHHAHDAQSLFYQMRFVMVHGRDGTWADAIAHCSPGMRELWERALRDRNAWTEPPEGVPVISEPTQGT